MSTEAAAREPAPYSAPREGRDRRYLFGPVVDFLCLGGSSFLILPLLMLVPVEPYKAQVASLMLILAHAINHPHFAHSYQLFYRGFRAKAFTRGLGAGMQARYILAGILVPIGLAGFFAYCIFAGDVGLLGQGANIMALFVGWHYVKQGYGMLMLDAVLKRRFFNDGEKKLLLINSYAVWAAAWLSANRYVRTNELFGLQYYTLDLPDPLVLAAQTAALLTSLAALWAFFTHWRNTGQVLVNGAAAYVVSLYVWLLFVHVHPLWVFVVPALHSIQYLIVVWRFELNYERDHVKKPEFRKRSLVRDLFGDNLAAHLAMFGAGGLALGFLGFWGVPLLLNVFVPYDQQLFGGLLFLFVAWIFINVHHYFLDNVMWRRENPDTKRFLFS